MYLNVYRLNLRFKVTIYKYCSNAPILIRTEEMKKKIKFGYSSYFLFKLTIVTCLNKQINNIIKLNERIIEKKITK